MRVSNLATKNQMMSDIKRNYIQLQKTEKQLGSGKRFQKASQDPINSITTIYSNTRMNQINQYTKNLGDSQDKIRVTHDTIQSIVSITQRIREITIQAANSTFNGNDRNNIAIEVEENLKEIIAQANASFETNFLFAGDKTKTVPFEIVYNQNDRGYAYIENVIYNGDQFHQDVEIGLNETITTSLTGNQVFWAENQTIVSLKDSENYISSTDQKISIDNQIINITTGDNLDVVIDRINEGVPSVKAFKRRLPSGEMVFVIESNYPHKIPMLDLAGGTVLRDLGILKPGEEGNQVFKNISENTVVNNGSLFDAIIKIRNSILDNNVENLGTVDLTNFDSGFNNLLKNQTKISATSSRINNIEKFLALEKENIIIRLSKAQDVDMAEAAINLSEINNIHRISLQTAAKYIRPVLLDYL